MRLKRGARFTLKPRWTTTDEVYSLVSVAGSVRVTQYSHQTNTNYTSKPPKGVHTMVPKNVFTPDQAASISRQTRTGS